MDESEKRATEPTAFVDALKVASKSGYLGDHDVVENLLREMAGKLTDAPTAETVSALADEFSLILSGQDPDYTPMPVFHTRSGMAQTLADHVDVDPDQTFLDLGRQLFYGFALDVLEAIKAEAADRSEEAATLLDAALERYTSIIIGTADTTHPTGQEEA